MEDETFRNYDFTGKTMKIGVLLRSDDAAYYLALDGRFAGGPNEGLGLHLDEGQLLRLRRAIDLALEDQARRALHLFTR